MRDLTNMRFGQQVAIRPCGKNKSGNILWLCKCDCGNTHVVPSGKLVQGKSKSCGCYRRKNSTCMLEKHGITTGGKPRTFIIWNGMKSRCLNHNSTSYKNYGGRGISICDEWLVFENFHNWAMANGYKDWLQIDRIDNDGNYEPSNCRWVTRKENMRNCSYNHYIEIMGMRKIVSDWIKELGISKTTAYKYLKISDKAFVEYVINKKGQIYFINKFIGDIK